MADTHTSIPCDDFTLFKQALTKLRKVDDLVTQKLNMAIPTDTFKRAESVETKQQGCHQFYTELQAAYKDRQQAIGQCIRSTEKTVEEMRKRKAASRDDYQAQELLSDAQSRLRMMQQELAIESIIEERSMKTFTERCSSFEVLQR